MTILAGSLNPEFELHPQLVKDSVWICDWPLCQLRLINDKNYPWFILVPRRPAVREIIDLSEVPDHAPDIAALGKGTIEIVPAPGSDGVKLAVGQVAGRRRHRMGVGMGGDQRRIRKRRHIVEPGLVQVAQIDDHAQRIAFAHQPLARRRQPRPGVRAARKPERHAMAKDRRARPDRPQ